MMRKSALLSLSFALLAAASAADRAAAGAEEPGKVRSFELTYSASIVDLPGSAGRVRVWIPYPVSDSYQTVEVLKVDAPYPTSIERHPETGNSMVYMEVAGQPAAKLEIEMTVRVARSERLTRIATTPAKPAKAVKAGAARPPEVARWLRPDELVPLSERIRKLAAEVTRGRSTDLEKARAIYDYVVDTMSYDKSGTGWGRGDIYWACDAKRGNCTDFHALFTGLARASGIPAKFAIGFPIPADRGTGDVGGYHCWSEFYLAGQGWVPVDASEARKHPEKRDYFFGAHDENRVQFSIGRDLELAPRQQGKPLNFFIYPYVEVDGQPFAGVRQKFAYRDVSLEGAVVGR
jgi:transglutaminase-like putative cysteine protease